MPSVSKPSKFFKIRRFLPKNRVQRIYVPNPTITYRPLRMERRDVVIRGLLKESPDWWSMHRRGPEGRPKTFEGNPDEMRGVPKSVAKGTLPERIIYLELLKRNFVEGLDFTFQSSQEGGRTELGGIVVDFLFEFLRIALEVQGPTHDTVIGRARDRDKEKTLSSMGFTLIAIDTDVIDDPNLLEAWFRRYFDFGVVSILDPFDTYVDEVGGPG